MSFQNTIAVSNGLSDFHKMVITVMKVSFKKHSPIERHYRDYKYFEWTQFKKHSPTERHYRDYKYFDRTQFKKHSPIERHYRDYKYFDRTQFKNNLNETLSEGICNYKSFETTFIEVLNKHVPLRKNFLELIMLHTSQKP